MLRSLFLPKVLRDFEHHLSARTRRVFAFDGHFYSTKKGLELTFEETNPSEGVEPVRFRVRVSQDGETYEGSTAYEPATGSQRVYPFSDLDAETVVDPRVVLNWVGKLREAYEHKLPGLHEELDRLLAT